MALLNENFVSNSIHQVCCHQKSPPNVTFTCHPIIDWLGEVPQ